MKSITAISAVFQPRALILAFAGMAAAVAPQVRAASDSDGDYARGRILVEPRAGLTAGEFDKLLKAHGGKARKIGQGSTHIVELPANASEKAVVAQLKNRPEFKFVELDRRVKSSYVVNDPYAGGEWHLNNIGAAAAWDSAKGAGVTIAILDSGVDGAHPDLQANLVAGYNVYGNNTDTSDVCGHGTAVAGSAAARSDNGVGVAGVAGQARIMPVRIAYLDPTYGCYAYYSTVASGLTYAADHGARIANVSYGGVAGSAAVQSAAQYMRSKGGLVFVSAGNNGKDEGLAPTSTMIVVSATDGSDTKASWSSYGNFVSLAAPGSGIWTTSKGGLYQTWNGTSFAAPVAAAAAALLMSARPDLSPAQVETILFNTAKDLGAAGRDNLYGYGRVNAAAAMTAALAAPTAPDTQAPSVAIAAPLGSSTVSGAATVSVNASDNTGVARVDLQVNGAVVASADAAPYVFSWDSTGVANGMNNLVAVAYDAAGNRGNSSAVAVNVANALPPAAPDTVAPVVVLTNPVAGRVNGNVNVTVNASDNSGAAGIRLSLYIDGSLKASGSGSSLSYSWNTKKEAVGTHTVQTRATDAAGNTSTATVQVTR
ncbi:peptidase S8 [Massilia sp. Root351]|uniref:S8 family serine peptidase n=1 Tax=Massilia sp. Root351 TaxID=1736522 RepID=UPI000709BBB6|nr:S8 family serine peptidase [Massilia sp. Root351]KQV84864.1 peptidase S8 [Massilia sp. Root351]